MSCLTVTFENQGGIETAATRVGGITTSATRVGGITTTATRKGGISCHMYMECRSGRSAPYLEISPTVVWILVGQTENDVFSNVHWTID